MNTRITKVCEDCKASFLTPPGNPQVRQCKTCWDIEAKSLDALADELERTKGLDLRRGLPREPDEV